MNTMRTLLLAALCCVCLALPFPTLQRKSRDTGDEAPGPEPPAQNNSIEEFTTNNTQKDQSWFDIIYEANNGIDFTGKYVIRHLDVAYRIGRGASPCPHNVCLWPKSSDGFVYVPHSVAEDLGSYGRTVIAASLGVIEDATCIRFRPRTSETDYMNFQPTEGCWASLGHVGGAQNISLQKSSCLWTGIVLHEVLHTLGLQHEHGRSDRDSYVKVQWNNVQASSKPNFMKTDTFNENLTAYDYQSIMHYSNTAFSVNGFPTLIPIPNNTIQLGKEFSMSDLDIVKINTLYKCSITNQKTTTTTKAPTTTTTTRTTTTTAPTKTILNGCGGNLTTPGGVFTSPNYPNDYPNNAYCHWNITTNTKFRVTFTDFDIEGEDDKCLLDKLMIYNGRGFDATYRLKDLCRKNLPSPITSNGNSMQFVFISSPFIGHKGFRVVYSPI